VTTPYDIEITPTARKQIHALPQKQQKTVLKLLEALAVNPRPPGTHKIEGMTGLYKQAVPPLTIIYKIEDQEVLILIAK
jgi:mRNA interferase RelE/StbE